MITHWLADLGFDRRPAPQVSARRFGAYAIEVTIFTVPFQGALSGGTARLTQLVGLVAIAAALPGLLAGGIRRWPNPAHVALMGWVAIGLASWFWTGNEELSLFRIQTIVQLLALVLLMWEFSEDAGQRRRFLVAFVLGTVAAIGLSISDYASASASRATFERFSAGDDTNPNDLGATIALAMPIVWYLSLTTYSRLRRVLLVALIPAGLLGVVLTASRTGLVVAGAGLLAAAVLSIRELGLVRIIAGLVLAPIIVLGVLAVAPDKAVARLETINQEVNGEGTLSERETLWPTGLEVFAEHPVAGVGIGASRFAIEDKIRRQSGAHNSFISVAAELGSIGLGFVLATLLLIALGLHHQPSLERRIGWTLLGAVVLAMMPLHWEYSKTLWVMLAFLIAGLETAPLPFPTEPPSAREEGAVDLLEA